MWEALFWLCVGMNVLLIVFSVSLWYRKVLDKELLLPLIMHVVAIILCAAAAISYF